MRCQNIEKSLPASEVDKIHFIHFTHLLNATDSTLPEYVERMLAVESEGCWKCSKTSLKCSKENKYVLNPNQMRWKYLNSNIYEFSKNDLVHFHSNLIKIGLKIEAETRSNLTDYWVILVISRFPTPQVPVWAFSFKMPLPAAVSPSSQRPLQCSQLGRCNHPQSCCHSGVERCERTSSD